MITTVQCSICSQLNNKPRVVSEILGCTIPAVYGFTHFATHAHSAQTKYLTLNAHARSEGYCSFPVCVCVSVRSFLPPCASRPRNIVTYVFTAKRKKRL